VATKVRMQSTPLLTPHYKMTECSEVGRGNKNIPSSRQVCKMEKYDDNVKSYIVKAASLYRQEVVLLHGKMTQWGERYSQLQDSFFGTEF